MTNEKYTTPNKFNWCPSCGNYSIWTAFVEAAKTANWDNANTAIVAGIGCHGHIVNFLKLSSIEALHGRPIPVAAGLKLANHDLNVFVFTGDGDCLAEGGNHLIHAARRNHDITVLLHDNAIYGLTTGQTSPRSPLGYISKSTPTGNIEEPLSPVRLALAAGATFVARVYAGDLKGLKDLIIKANEHKGFSFIDILQPCVTYNKVYSHDYYQKNTYSLPEDFNRQDINKALEKSFEWDEKKIPVGIFYQIEKPTYEMQVPAIKTQALIKIPLGQKRDIKPIFSKFF